MHNHTLKPPIVGLLWQQGPWIVILGNWQITGCWPLAKSLMPFKVARLLKCFPTFTDVTFPLRWYVCCTSVLPTIYCCLINYLLTNIEPPLLSWHLLYQVFSAPIAFRSWLARSLHLLLVPWLGLVFLSSQNNSFFGSRPSSILPTWPSHFNRCSIITLGMVQAMPNLSVRAWVVSLSCHCWYLVTPSIVLHSDCERRLAFVCVGLLTPKFYIHTIALQKLLLCRPLSW